MSVPGDGSATAMPAGTILYTIGHSNHTAELFLQLLQQHTIDVLVDVRSQPFSRYNPQFNRETLQSILSRHSIQYVFMGDQLGGRPEGSRYLDEDGHVLYHRVAEASFFQEGIGRLEHGMQSYRVSIMCSEEDPRICHRHRLIARVLRDRGIEVRHIRDNGCLQSYEDVEPAEQQKVLFGEMENDSWRSLQSVLPKPQPPNSLES